MKVNYNIRKEERKAMVTVVSKVRHEARLLWRTKFFLQDRSVRDHQGRQPLL